MSLLLAIAINLIFALLGIIVGCFVTSLRYVSNKSRDWNESKYYYVQWNPFNKPRTHAFTPNDLKTASSRIVTRPEDFR